jgi:hypoxanthine phosphoribosyltransferase
MSEKIELPHELFKALCIDLALKINERYQPNGLIAISRGGISAAHIMAKKLRLQIGYYFPKDELLIPYPGYVDSDPLIFIEDLVAEGRTFLALKKFITSSEKYSKSIYDFVPILVDKDFDYPFNFYGLKTGSWIVFPYEQSEKVIVGDRGLFRNRTGELDAKIL